MEVGEEGMDVREEGEYHYIPKNDSCIKMGNGECHFNVSLIVRDKVTRHCPQTTIYLKTKES